VRLAFNGIFAEWVPRRKPEGNKTRPERPIFQIIPIAARAALAVAVSVPIYSGPDSTVGRKQQAQLRFGDEAARPERKKKINDIEMSVYTF